MSRPFRAYPDGGGGAYVQCLNCGSDATHFEPGTGWTCSACGASDADENPPAGDCTCPDGDTWACIDGIVYGPCTSERCSGVCEQDGTCECTAEQHKPGRHGTPWPPW